MLKEKIESVKDKLFPQKYIDQLADFEQRAPRILVHAVSAGEVLQAYSFIFRLREKLPESLIIVSTQTTTGIEMAQRLLAKWCDCRVTHPMDIAYAVKRAISSIKPDLYINVESEIWPNFIRYSKDSNVNCLSVNPGHFPKKNLLSRLFSKNKLIKTYSCFDKFIVNSDSFIDKLKEWGVKPEKVITAKSLKVDSILTRRKFVNKESLMNQYFIKIEDKIVIAGSVRRQIECDCVLKAFKTLKSMNSLSKFILAPRHSYLAKEIAGLSAEKYGFRTQLISAVKDSDWDVLVVDMMGILFDLYSLAESAFVGGSLVKRGGQNIMEPASWGIPVCYGPSMEDFANEDIMFRKYNISRIVHNEKEIADFWQEATSSDDMIKIAKKGSDKFFNGLGGGGITVSNEALRLISN